MKIVYFGTLWTIPALVRREFDNVPDGISVGTFVKDYLHLSTKSSRDRYVQVNGEVVRNFSQQIHGDKVAVHVVSMPKPVA